MRFEDDVIRVGVQGCLNVMKSLKMITLKPSTKPKKKCYRAESSHWVRAPQGGCVRIKKKLGQGVVEGDLLGVVSDPFDLNRIPFYATTNGVVIGVSNVPLVNKGDAIMHLASTEKSIGKNMIDYLDE